MKTNFSSKFLLDLPPHPLSIHCHEVGEGNSIVAPCKSKLEKCLPLVTLGNKIDPPIQIKKKIKFLIEKLVVRMSVGSSFFEVTMLV